MKIASPCGIAVRMHPLFLLTLLLSALTGLGAWVAAALLALALHESGHLLAAKRLGLLVSQIELTPFGGSMRIDQAEGLTGKAGFFLAAAGIAVNALCFGFSVLALQFGAESNGFLSSFLSANLYMLAVNLLPALPLDGGRMLLALLCVRFPRKTVFSVLLAAGRLIAGALLGASILLALRGVFRPSFAMLASYLLYAAALEERCGVARYLTAYTTRRIRLEDGRAVPLQALCVGGAMPLHTLLEQLQPGAFHMVLVLDDDAATVRRALQEKELLAAALENPGATVAELLS